MTFSIGCDTGGTFTDFVAFDSAQPQVGLSSLKVSSTPDDPSRAIFQGVAKLVGEGSLSQLCHATTVATNSLLEGTTGRVVFLTTAGFGDLLWLGRGDRRELFSLRPSRVSPPVLSSDVFEVSERITAQGQVRKALDEAALQSLLAKVRIHLEENPITAIGVCLFHASHFPQHEVQVGQALKALGLPVFLSHQIAPSVGEYERAMTTVIAAGLAAKIDHYLKKLEGGLAPQQSSQLWIVHSSGGLLQAEEARQSPHRLALSGPAAGLRGALAVGLECGCPNLITLDIGGTSSDVALCLDGQLPYIWESEVEGLPLRAPSLEIHTIGAGGGSMARVDAGGLLRVGPQSAGAQPGPACYGRGGETATVTDALCWAGYLPQTLGRTLELSRQASQAALEKLGKSLGADVDQTANAIIALTVGHLGLAVRKVSTGRGQDPRQYALFPFGGAGPMLACQVAESLDMDRILVPARAGVLSAWGALTAPWEREWSLNLALEHRGDTQMAEQLLAKLESDLQLDSALQLERLVARRYRGQGDSLVSPLEQDFHELHRQQFGFCRPDSPVEQIEVRLRARARGLGPSKGTAQEIAPTGSAAAADVGYVLELEKRQLLTAKGWIQVPVFDGDLGLDQHQAGPFLHFGDSATLYVAPGWAAQGLAHGHCLLRRNR
jgi:N-methylhydantoinase A